MKKYVVSIFYEFDAVLKQIFTEAETPFDAVKHVLIHDQQEEYQKYMVELANKAADLEDMKQSLLQTDVYVVVNLIPGQ